MDLAAWFQELRRRRVIRALLGWGLLSFAVLQVVEPLQHALGLGEWFLKAVVAVLAMGFPVTAGLSWAFDLTRSGVTRTPPAPDEGSTRRGPARAFPVAAVAIVGALIGAAVAGLAGWHLWGRTPATGPDGRITVAVADVVNDTKDGELDGLSAQLITSLEQSQKLRVLTRSRMVDVLRQLGKANVPVVDEVMGREMARAAGVQALVVASIRRFDRLYAIDVKVLDPSTSEYFFTLKEEREGKGAIPGMLDRLSERTRERLRETPAQVSASAVRIADATTRSYQAWQEYYEGLKLEGELRYSRAMASYRKAVELDPRFALAWYRIAYLGEFVWLPEEQRDEAMAAALREIDRVPAKERLLLQAWKAHMERRDDEARETYAQAAVAYPQDKAVLYMAGDLEFHKGEYAPALAWFEKALALDPSWPDALSHQVDALVGLGRGEEAVRTAREWMSRSPGRAARTALAEALFAAGRPDDAVEVTRALAAEEPDAKPALGHALIRAERFEEATEVLRPLFPGSDDDGIRRTVSLILSLTYQGRIREALAVVDEAARVPGLPRWFELGMRWNVHAAGRNVPAALRYARALDDYELREGRKPSQFAYWYALVGEDRLAAESGANLSDAREKAMHDAISTWRRGDLATALARVRGLDESPEIRPRPAWWHAYLAGEAREDAEAVAATDRFERSDLYAPWRGGGSAQLLYRKALSQERLGDLDGARASIARLLGWWRRADPDLPLLAEARALCKRLECRPPDLLPRK